MSQPTYSWRTKKVGENEFQWRVIKIVSRTTPNEKGSYADIELVKSGVLPTRARAMGMAKKWANYYSRFQKLNKS